MAPSAAGLKTAGMAPMWFEDCHHLSPVSRACSAIESYQLFVNLEDPWPIIVENATGDDGV